MTSASTGVERFIDHFYNAYPHQAAFHGSPLRHRLLGGAAGPGKTYALIMDHMMNCDRFSLQDAPQVHTLLLRRTYPKLEATVITRFREKIPRELYAKYDEQKHIVTWTNGSTTQFGSMQYEHDVWGWQGQWYKIGYDELTEFTFPQWSNTSAWNRCPVSPHATKDGATNPIGIGAAWVEDLFVNRRACSEMDAKQRENYHPRDYGYFPATYRDNPVYANDANWVAGLDSYQDAIAMALKEGKWGVAGGYFQGAWDEAINSYNPDSVELKSWWKRWMGGDWGFEHNSALYWNCVDDLGIVRCYRELVCNRHTPEELGERIVKENNGDKIVMFSLSHDAFAQRHDSNPIAHRIGAVLVKAGLPHPEISTKDAKGREQILYDSLKARVKIGEIFDDAHNRTEAVLVPRLQIADTCTHLMRAIGKAPRDEKNSERIAEFLGDDPLQGEGYALYAHYGKPNQKPFSERMRERLAEIDDPTSRNIQALRLVAEHKKQTAVKGRMRWQWQRPRK